MASESVRLERVRAALALDHPYRFAAQRERALTALVGRPVWTPASVLVLLGDPGPSVLVTKRTEEIETHKGQMAFPGGMREADETDEQAALRETFEEVGISPESVTVLGRLPTLQTPTGFEIAPMVGWLAPAVDQVALQTSADEIAQTYWIPLPDLTAPGVYREEILERGSLRFPIDVYYANGERIWGATGSMLRNFMERLERVGGWK